MRLVVGAPRVSLSHSSNCKFGGETGTSTTTPTTPIGDPFFLTTLTELQVELQQKLLEVKVAADRLTGYTKMLVAVPVSNTSPTVASTSTTPSAAPAAKAKDNEATLRRGGRKIKLSAKAQAAVDSQK